MVEKKKNDSEVNTTAVQPGQVISPASSDPVAEALPPSETSSPENLMTASNIDQPTEITESTTEPDSEAEVLRDKPSDPAVISWTASEFVAHHKSAGWYGSLALATTIFATVIYFLTKDTISTLVVVIVGFIFGITAARQPKQQQYKLNDGGINIGQKYYSFQSFRSFSVVNEGAFSSIVFMPLKRFAPMTSIYFAPEDEDRIISILSDRLPFEEHQHDAIDRLMQRIRF